MIQEDDAGTAWHFNQADSSIVDRRRQHGPLAQDDRPGRTSALHGITGPELERLTGAVQFMEERCQPRLGALWWLTTDKGTDRSAIAEVWKRITRLQTEGDLPPYSLVTFETRGGRHAHIVSVGSREIAGRLQASEKFAGRIVVRPVTNSGGLSRKYLAKERTPQAGYRREYLLGGRLRGSHRLAGGGDRVRLSEALERDAIVAGYIQRWQHTYARRSEERKPYRLRRLLSNKTPRPAGQLPLFPELDKPVSRLHDFFGGIVPPAVALEIEFRRRRHGWTQRQLAALLGRTQGTYANAIRGHDPLSPFAVDRLRGVFLLPLPRRG